LNTISIAFILAYQVYNVARATIKKRKVRKSESPFFLSSFVINWGQGNAKSEADVPIATSMGSVPKGL